MVVSRRPGDRACFLPGGVPRCRSGEEQESVYFSRWDVERLKKKEWVGGTSVDISLESTCIFYSTLLTANVPTPGRAGSLCGCLHGCALIKAAEAAG